MLTPLTFTLSPIPLSEVKAFLRVDHSDEDEILNAMLSQAVELVERRTHRALGSQKWRLVSGVFSSSVELPRPPFVGIDAVTYLSTDGNRKAWASYRVEAYGSGTPARLVLTDTPADLDTPAGDAWHISYTAGDILPPGLRSALLLIVSRLYDQRTGDDSAPILSTGIERLLNLYTIPNR